MNEDPPNFSELAENAAQGDEDAREEMEDHLPAEVVDDMVEQAKVRLEQTTFESAVSLFEQIGDGVDAEDIPDEIPDDAMELVEHYPWDDGTTEQMALVAENWNDESVKRRWAFCWVHDNARRDVNEFFN